MRQRLVDAFPPLSRPNYNRIVGTIVSGDLERPEVAAYFRNRRWDEMTCEDLLPQSDVLPLFSPLGFQYFLPASLACALAGQEASGDMAEFALYSLWRPDDPEHMGRVGSVMTPKQAEVIADWIRLMGNIYPDEEAELERAIVFWKDRAKQTSALSSRRPDLKNIRGNFQLSDSSIVFDVFLRTSRMDNIAVTRRGHLLQCSRLGTRCATPCELSE